MIAVEAATYLLTDSREKRKNAIKTLSSTFKTCGTL